MIYALSGLWIALAGWLVARGTTPQRVVALRPERRRITLANRLGHALRKLGRRPADEHADRALGRAALIVGPLALLDPVVGVVAAGAALVAHRLGRRTAFRRTVAQRIDAMPEFVDLLRLATATGRTLHLALPVAAQWGPQVLRSDLATAQRALDHGQSMDRVLADLGEAWGEAGAPVVAGLVDHDRYGTALGPTLDRVTDDARRVRRHAGEARIRRLPVTLLFPLVLCTLPAFGLLSIGPLIAGSLQSLLDGGLEAPASIDSEPSKGSSCIDLSSPSTSSPCP
jgi:tight adherence protein C